MKYLLIVSIIINLFFLFLLYWIVYLESSDDNKYIYQYITYNNIKSDLKSGDMLLFSNQSYTLIPRIVGHPTFSHIGMVVKKNNQLYSLEIVDNAWIYRKKKKMNGIIVIPLKDRIKNVLIEIYNQYPAAIKSSAVSILNPSIVDYVTYPIEKRSEFKVNLYGISNPFEIEYTTSGTTRTDNENISQYRNFSKRFRDYVVFYNGIEYPIIDVLLPVNYDDETNGLRLIIDGNPFNNVICCWCSFCVYI
jgi:hypothetical protein